MKYKISILISFILLFSTFTLQAQKNFAIVRAGINLANVTTTNDGRISDANMLTSFQIGMLANVHVAPFLSFQPGLLFTGKGSKTQSGSPSDPTYFKATSNPWYVEIPANFVFKTPATPVKFFAGAGLYLAIGFAGKNTSDGKYLGVAFHNEETIKWSNDDPSTLNYEEGSGFGIMKRFDYGLNGLIGVEGKLAIFSVNYGYGLAKLQSGSNSSANNNNKHRVLSIMVGLKL